MRPHVQKSAIVLLALLAASQVGAQEARDYQCAIERVANADGADGKVLEAQKKALVGKSFTVSRRTGVMAGALKNSYITRPEVIDVGSSENSFKVVTTLRREQGLGPGSNVYVLVVREYEKGAKKPFVFLDNDELYFGTCLHF